jgi:two-component system, chemotaxis family, chemotaxis protein CheY
MKKKIIVVEDFNTSRQVIRKALEGMGYDVYDAADGREALRFFDGSRIDMVITDYNMPYMDGASLVEYIRAKEAYRYIPILVLSTETCIDKQKKAREARITGWITKPFEISAFKNQVQRLLS